MPSTMSNGPRLDAMTNIRDPDPAIEKVLTQRQLLVVEAKKFGSILNDPSTPMEEIDASFEELRPIRLTIRAIDSQIRELLKIH